MGLRPGGGGPAQAPDQEILTGRVICRRGRPVLDRRRNYRVQPPDGRPVGR